jgi:hypothetical protein
MRIPIRGRRARWLTLVYGLLLFLWLSPEDNQVWPVAVLGWGLAALTIIMTLVGRIGGQMIPNRYLLPGAGLLGALIGLGASLAAVALMLFKNAMHAHLFLDFPPGLMIATLERAPVWALAGALAGLGLGLAWLAVKPLEV